VLGTALGSLMGFSVEHGVHAGRRGRRGDREVAHTPVYRGGIGVVWKTEQLLGLLLLKSPHLILEYLALEKTLALVLETLELDTLQQSSVSIFLLLAHTRSAHGGHIRQITA
jgi:hypothetical protein